MQTSLAICFSLGVSNTGYLTCHKSNNMFKRNNFNSHPRLAMRQFNQEIHRLVPIINMSKCSYQMCELFSFLFFSWKSIFVSLSQYYPHNIDGLLRLSLLLYYWRFNGPSLCPWSASKLNRETPHSSSQFKILNHITSSSTKSCGRNLLI